MMEERIHDINPDVSVVTHRCFFLPENADEFPFEEYDYIVTRLIRSQQRLRLS